MSYHHPHPTPGKSPSGSSVSEYAWREQAVFRFPLPEGVLSLSHGRKYSSSASLSLVLSSLIFYNLLFGLLLPFPFLFPFFFPLLSLLLSLLHENHSSSLSIFQPDFTSLFITLIASSSLPSPHLYCIALLYHFLSPYFFDQPRILCWPLNHLFIFLFFFTFFDTILSLIMFMFSI